MTTADEAILCRPSRHGKALGIALAKLADAGRLAAPDAPSMCATCAFRAGSTPNMTAETGMVALNIILGIDRDDFACHHGMKDGQPTKRCVGAYLAALAPFPMVKAALAAVRDGLNAASGEDEVRAKFDRWWDSVDPDHKLDIYELASAYARHLQARPATIESQEAAASPSQERA